MSVSKMKRLTVFTPAARVDELVGKLMRLRCVELSYTDADAESLELERVDADASRLSLEAHESEIWRAIGVLDPYVERKKPLFAQKYKVNTSDFINNGYEKQAEKTVAAVLSADERKNKIKDEIAKHKADIIAAEPYLSYDLPLSFSGTETTDTFLGMLPPATDLDSCGKELYAAGAVAEILLQDKNGVYAVFFCHRSQSSDVLSLLNSYGFLRASFSEISLTARDCKKEALRRIKLLEAETESIEAKLKKLSVNIELLEVLYDLNATRLATVKEKQKMSATEKTVMLRGWIPARREAAVVSFLEGFECAYETSEPEGEEIPPVLLENNGFASNFEWVLGMYSYPAYGKFDPTFIMSIFYFIIFGIMFADVGYGLVLLLACFGAVKLLKPGESMKRFLKMFGYCGISCIIFGALFGAYFGDLPLAFMRNMLGMTEEQLPNLSIIPAEGANMALFLDPLQNPMGFLIFSLAVGAVHLLAGMAVNFVLLCRDGRALDAIFDIGSYWVLFAGIGLLFVFPSVGMWVAIAGALMILLTHGRAEKNIIKKITGGLLGLYDLINYASDLLSYSRILALGLSAGIIGQVVNILGTMGGPTVVGFIMLVLVFIVGHLINLAINVLGTFVHTSRLQYIEFFGKFYEDGGVPFEPVLPSEKYTEDISEN